MTNSQKNTCKIIGGGILLSAVAVIATAFGVMKVKQKEITDRYAYKEDDLDENADVTDANTEDETEEINEEDIIE